jgi:hypothetical protein
MERHHYVTPRGGGHIPDDEITKHFLDKLDVSMMVCMQLWPKGYDYTFAEIQLQTTGFPKQLEKGADCLGGHYNFA